VRLAAAIRRAVAAEVAVAVALLIGSAIYGAGPIGAGAGTSVPAASVCDTTKLVATPEQIRAALGVVETKLRVVNEAGQACALGASAAQGWLATVLGSEATATRLVQTELASASKTLGGAVSKATGTGTGAKALSIAAGAATTVIVRYDDAAATANRDVAGLQRLLPIKLPPLTLPTITVPAILDPKPAPKPPSPPAKKPPPAPSGPTRYKSGSTGYDISWPQCRGAYPSRPYTAAVVGANDGSAFTTNPCLASERSWAGSSLELYLNVNSPAAIDSHSTSGPAGRCSASNTSCLAYNFGYNDAASTVAYDSSHGIRAATWWLDVETAGRCANQFPTRGAGYWSCNQALNSRTIQGALDALRAQHEVVGIYSTHYQWGVITRGYTPSGGSAPTWIPGSQASQARSECSTGNSFEGGTPWMLQMYGSRYDVDRAC
jgi:hypothetical protein